MIIAIMIHGTMHKINGPLIIYRSSTLMTMLWHLLQFMRLSEYKINCCYILYDVLIVHFLIPEMPIGLGLRVSGT